MSDSDFKRYRFTFPEGADLEQEKAGLIAGVNAKILEIYPELRQIVAFAYLRDGVREDLQSIGIDVFEEGIDSNVSSLDLMDAIAEQELDGGRSEEHTSELQSH